VSAANNFFLSKKERENSYVEWIIHKLPIKQRWKPNDSHIKYFHPDPVHEAGRRQVKSLSISPRHIVETKVKFNSLLTNITSQVLSPAKGTHYQLKRGLVEPHIWSGSLREEKYRLPLPQLTGTFVYRIIVATPTNLKHTYLHSKLNFFPFLQLLTSNIMEPQNLVLVGPSEID
jgi:hypothetical protein